MGIKSFELLLNYYLNHIMRVLASIQLQDCVCVCKEIHVLLILWGHRLFTLSHCGDRHPYEDKTQVAVIHMIKC